MRPGASLLLALALSLALLRAARAQDAAEDPRAAVEARAARATCWVGEALVLRLEVRLDEAWFSAHAVPLFRQASDLPVQVRAPWWEGGSGLPRLADPPADAPDAERRTLAVNESIVEAHRQGGAGPPTAWAVERRFLAAKEGEIRLDPPTLRYAHAARFEEDALGGRVPVGVEAATVAGAPLVLRVLPLPSEGRPEGFSGAVGRFTIAASAAPDRVRAGEALRLTLVVQGEGNLETVPTPSLKGFEGFHLFGAADDRGPWRRTVVYDLAPVADSVQAVPSVAFPYFDPEPPASYRVVRTASLPLAVEPGPPAAPAGPEPPPPPPPAPSWVGWAPLAALLALAALAAAGAVRRRRRAREAEDPTARRALRVAQARARFASAAAAPGADLSSAWAQFLGVVAHAPAGAVVSEDLAERLLGAGVPPGTAARAADALKALVEARYGSLRPAPDRAALDALAAEVAVAFPRGSGAGSGART